MDITDDKLLKIALVTSLIGLIGLIMFTPSIEVGNSYFLTINDGTGQMPLVIFESQVSQMQTNNMDIQDFKNKKVNVVGKITEYNNEMEIVLSSGDSLKILN